MCILYIMFISVEILYESQLYNNLFTKNHNITTTSYDNILVHCDLKKRKMQAYSTNVIICSSFHFERSLKYCDNVVFSIWIPTFILICFKIMHLMHALKACCVMNMPICSCLDKQLKPNFQTFINSSNQNNSFRLEAKRKHVTCSVYHILILQNQFYLEKYGNHKMQILTQ